MCDVAAPETVECEDVVEMFEIAEFCMKVVLKKCEPDKDACEGWYSRHQLAYRKPSHEPRRPAAVTTPASVVLPPIAAAGAVGAAE